ncbi:NHL repeat-containing protein [Flavobacterium selenitireducens]|uniref:hypothetical protein n=1 Tax=Flavobacterium selenitireducens TaxID=2722704 RepID=UPI00168BEBD1|nr:hypothetical protein [Flavobacterium selenitireducens]MBD3582991.1 hypothetical protein [Flavobacterium selenitireducens]
MKKILLCLAAALSLISCSGDDAAGCDAANASEKAATPFANGCGMAVSRTGRIAITVYNGGYGQAGTVQVFKNLAALKANDPQTTLMVTAPEAVAFDSDENLYVAETEAVAGVKVYQSNDYYFILNRTIQVGFVNPRGLAVDSQDRLYVCDDGNGRVVRFNNPLESNDFVELDGMGAGVKGIAINKDKLYVTNYNLNRVTQLEIGPGAEMAAVVTGEAEIEKATDVTTKGNKVVVTSFDSGKMTVLSNCDFSDEIKKEFSFGGCFGTAFLSGGKLLGAFYAEDAVKEISVN